MGGALNNWIIFFENYEIQIISIQLRFLQKKNTDKDHEVSDCQQNLSSLT